MQDLAVRAILIALVCNVACALLGTYLLLRRMSLIGDAIGHGVLPGIVFAFLLTGQFTGIPIILGALVLGFLTALLTQALHSSGKVTADASMGIVFTSLFALGVMMIARAGNADLDVGCVLYGRLLDAALVPEPIPPVLRGLTFSLLLTLGFIALLWKELKITSFDPALATAVGIRANVVHYLLMALVGGVTVAAFEAVGSILVVAMLIVPAATAHLLTDRLGPMLLLSCVAASLASVFGYLLTEVIDTSPAGMMAVVSGLLLMLAVFFSPRHGLLSKKLRNWRLRLRIASEDVLAMLYRLEEQGGTAAGATTPDLRRAARGWAGRLALRDLRRQRHIQTFADGSVRLTDAGRRRSRSLVRAHRLWESYLHENVALPDDHLHDVAHRMEHFIGPQLQEDLARELCEPQTDPHGRAIPPVPDGQRPG
jgi:ABC-type Mn2+/Zn2+ transport system permease subunit/Mn-dependent DtxR family transcriptional regulator